ncbi:MAG TPA: DUF2207 domain-containing protein, partial [Anaerolineae bacterium]|nr:DUF2207 domain-containing protein [Anaerolineae bacterium]
MLHRISTILIIVILLAGLGNAAWAQEKQVDWDRVDVAIQVHDDGTFTVEEIIQVTFWGEDFTYGYRDIPAEYVDFIDEFQVWDETGTYEEGIESGDRWFLVDDTVGGLYTVTWHFPPISNTIRTFHLRYRVHGGLRVYPGGDQLWWKAVFPDRDGPVASSTVTVTTPAAIQVYDAYFVPAEMTLLDEHTVQFRATEPVPPGVSFEVRVQWPHGVIPATPAPWQAAADAAAAEAERRARWNPIIALGLIFGSIGFFLLGVLSLFLLWYLRGRDPGAAPIAYLPEPPSDLPPALAGQLVDGVAKPRHVLATILDLANRGILDIEEMPKRQHVPQNYRFHLRGDFPQQLPRFERLALRTFMGRSQTRTLRDVEKSFPKHWKRMMEAQEEALVERGLFPHPPSQTIRRINWIGALMWAVAAIFFVLVLFDVLPRRGLSQSLVFWPMGALMLTGILFFATARFMIPRTPKGREEAARWRAFRRYLAELKDLDETPPAVERLDRFLAYAVAFGVEKSFLEEVEKTGAATWHPTWYHPSTSGGQGSSGGLGSVAQSAASGSSHMGSSLASMSAGLVTMLATASSSLSSTVSGGGSGGG